MVVFFSSLENHLLSLKLLIFNYFLRVKEDAWQICVEHFTVIWWWSSRSQRVNAVQLQLWGIVIFVRFLSFLVTAIIFFFVLWYSSSMHAWYTIPILITLSCIFLACMLVYISGFALDCLSSFTFVQNYCFALWYLGSTNSYVQGTGVVDSLIRWNHVKIYMFVFCLPLNQLTGSGHFYLLCTIEIIWRIVENMAFLNFTLYFVSSGNNVLFWNFW